MENLGIEFWKNKNVFVSGATGLLGSWLVEKLQNQGANVICLVRDWVPKSRLVISGLIDHITVVRGDLEDISVIVRALNEYEIDTVFHLGAQTIVGAASRSPISTFESNIRGTWNLLEACRQCLKLIQRIIVASSDKAYGSQKNLPYTENTPLQGQFPYDVSKSCADLISFSFFHTYNLPVAVTRCGNLFGGGDLNFNRLVPGTIRSILMNEPPIIRSDGKYIRDYIYVKDAVNAYLSLAQRLSHTNFAGEAFNFGYEAPLTVLELVGKLLHLSKNNSLKPVVLNEASHEIKEQYLDCTKARKLLKWEANYTMDDGLRDTITWYQDWLRD